MLSCYEYVMTSDGLQKITFMRRFALSCCWHIKYCLNFSKVNHSIESKKIHNFPKSKQGLRNLIGSSVPW